MRPGMASGAEEWRPGTEPLEPPLQRADDLIDEHSITVDAAPASVWTALGDVLSRLLHARYARAPG